MEAVGQLCSGCPVEMWLIIYLILYEKKLSGVGGSSLFLHGDSGMGGGAAGGCLRVRIGFPLCMLHSGDVVDSHCLGGKLGPVKLMLGSGGLVN